jgi:hypothetical protein
LEQVEAKIIETQHINLTHRLQNNRHGVMIVFDQSGEIARVSPQQILIQLTTSLGLLSVARFPPPPSLSVCLPSVLFFSILFSSLLSLFFLSSLLAFVFH